MYQIIALGESLIDFTPSGTNEQGIALFGCNPGGAPANVLAMNQKLGGKTAFIGMVGDDAFGHFLAKNMENAGIDTRGMRYSKKVHTTLAFVTLNESGDRDFSFYRKPGADICLSAGDVDVSLLADTEIFHFGSLSLTDEPARGATLFAIEKAREAGAIISYDPNYRPPLWDSPEQAAEAMKSVLDRVDIVKVSREELELLTGEKDIETGARALLALGATLVFVTDGEYGASYCSKNCFGFVPAFRVQAVDTTGSGDAFLGALLYRLAGRKLEALAAMTKEELEEAVRFGSAAGGLTATAKGAIPAMPDEAAIRDCMAHMPIYGQA